MGRARSAVHAYESGGAASAALAREIDVEFVVTEAEARRRLDEILAARIPEATRMQLRDAFQRGEVRVAGTPQPAGYRPAAGEPVAVELGPLGPNAMTPEPIPLRIWFEDAHLLVVEKPAGMVVHPAGRHRSGTLANALAYHLNVAGGARPPIRPGLVHRLDAPTSGLIVVAKTQAALSRLTIQFQARQVEKEYLALVHGRVEAAAGEWSAPIGADAAARPRWGVREGGRPAVSRFAVRERLPVHTLLALEPRTGRTHQLRIHAAHFGHPIVGDALFGRGAEPELAEGRLFLHAARLGFRHPITGEPLRFESPLPEPLARALARLREAA